MKYAYSFLFLLFSLFCLAQVPLVEIEGNTSIFLADDTTSVHIGKNAGLNRDPDTRLENTIVGTNAGRKLSYGVSNSFLGFNTGASNSSGSINSFFGSYAGNKNTTGSENNFFGRSAGLDNTTGFENNFFGTSAGINNSIGKYNSFFGDEAGYFNTAGEFNVFIGYESGHSNQIGDKNAFLGSYAGSGSTGDNNVAIGYHSGGSGGSVTNSVFIGYEAGRGAMNVTDALYINNASGDNPLIYGEFDNDLVRVNGELETEDGSIFMRNLGNTDTDQGIKWGESEGLEAFGLIYDGEGFEGNNRLHLREYVTVDSADILSIKVDGNVGIGTNDPLNDLEIQGDVADGVAGFTRSDLGGAKSHILFGNNGDWYIRPSLSSGKIIIADNGGNVGIGTSTPESTLEVNGKINIGNDNNTDHVGDIRYNTSNHDFEGFDGTDWLSLTGKNKIYTLNIGSGEIMIDTDDQEDFNISLANGYTTFTSVFGSDGYLFCPLQLPVGSKIIEVTYNYVDNNPADEISFELREYNEDSNGSTSFYQYTTSDLSLSGFETKSITSDLTLGANNYYTFIFTLRRTTATAYDSQKIQGVQVKYELP